MQDNKRNFSYYQEIEHHSKSWLPVIRNGWWIKFSTTFDTNILLVFTSRYTGQTLIRFFNQEDDAVKYINFLVEQDPKQEYQDQ